MTDTPKDLTPFPEWPKAAEVGMTAAKAVASLVAGGDLLDLLKMRLQNRQTAWLNDLAAHLGALEAEKRLSVEDVVTSPRFQDAVMSALASVRAARDEDKKCALRNAVLNVALGLSADDLQQDLFLPLVDRLTVWHLRVLKVFEDPVGWADAQGLDLQRAGHTTESFIAAAFPELAARMPHCKILWRDLFQSGLVTEDEAGTFSSGANSPSWRRPRITDLGRDFLRFIEEPSPPGSV